MKKFVLIFVLIMVSSGFGQNGGENKILFLNGGKTDITFSYYSQLISGIGNSIGYKSSQPWNIWGNPAGMITFKKVFVGVNIQPPLWVDPASFEDINKTIEEEIDNAIVDYRTDETKLVYPSITTKLNHKGGLYGFHFVKPVRILNNMSVLSFEIGQPFYMNLNTYNDGFETLIETRKDVGDQKKTIKMRMNALFRSGFLIKATQYTVGFAQKISAKTALGLKFGQTHVSADVFNQMKLDGIMETAGTEYAFNDPYDPRIDFDAGETNRLGQNAIIDFSGKGWNTQVGALFAINNSFVLGMDYDWHSEINLTGDMSVTQYKIPALNEDVLFGGNEEPDSGGEDLLDATKLDLAKLTLTKPVQNKIYDYLLLSFPSSLGIQTSYQGKIFETTLGFRKYFNTFGYELLDERYSANFNYGLQFIMSIGIFELALSAINAELIQEEIAETGEFEKINEPTLLWIPGASMSLGFFVQKSYQISTKLFFAPTPGLGIKLGYFF